MEIDIKKVIEEPLSNPFDIIDQLVKTQQEFLSALHIIKSTLDHPDSLDLCKERMLKFLYKYSQEKSENNNTKIVVWKDGTHLIVADGITFEYENDKNWLTTINP